jgi:hypothetical protein
MLNHVRLEFSSVRRLLANFVRQFGSISYLCNEFDNAVIKWLSANWPPLIVAFDEVWKCKWLNSSVTKKQCETWDELKFTKRLMIEFEHK